ncbi:MAG: tetratricopeptide repeat protein [Prevotellaceae bacterium]|jgi:tetratricopeptide (TPR) repeat protein|nr:tetratricopeptide repeat protein [Prevotellaceae bacterium]
MEYGEIDITSLIERYEKMHQDGQLCYFDVEDFESIISYYLYKNSTERARIAIDDGMHLHPSSLELKLKLIEVEVEDECWQNALSLIGEIKSYAFSFKAEIAVLEARAMLLQQNVDEAIATIDHLIETHLNVKDIDLQTFAGDLLNVSEYAHAARYLEFMRKHYGNIGNLLLDLAYCYERLDDRERAIKIYQKYLDENPFSTLAWFELAKLYEQDRQYGNAIQAYDFVLTIDSAYFDAYCAKADLQIAEGEHIKAIETLQSLLDEDINNTRALYVIGECYEKLGSLNDALKSYLQLIEYNDIYADAYYAAAFVLKDLGRIQECMSFLKKATVLEPTSSEYFYGLGKVMMEYGQYNEAINAFKGALENDKYDFESWLLLAELYASMDFGKALSLLEQASDYLYDIPEISYRIAALYFLTAEMDKCVEHFERAVLLDAEKADGFFDICPAARHDERIMTVYINNKIKNSI